MVLVGPVVAVEVGVRVGPGVRVLVGVLGGAEVLVAGEPLTVMEPLLADTARSLPSGSAKAITLTERLDVPGATPVKVMVARVRPPLTPLREPKLKLTSPAPAEGLHRPKSKPVTEQPVALIRLES